MEYNQSHVQKIKFIKLTMRIDLWDLKVIKLAIISIIPRIVLRINHNNQCDNKMFLNIAMYSHRKSSKLSQHHVDNVAYNDYCCL